MPAEPDYGTGVPDGGHPKSMTEKLPTAGLMFVA
jgi:hypothetical protein